jgi:hypothetical protein
LWLYKLDCCLFLYLFINLEPNDSINNKFIGYFERESKKSSYNKHCYN